MDFLDYNIYVPSKNRVENCNTILNSNNYIINIVVEPQEYEKYLKTFPMHNIIVLPQNDQGITFVRNYIKEYTENLSIPFYWQLDDDISGFFYREKTSLIRSDFSILKKAQDIFEKNSVSLGGIEYRQFAWSANKALIFNSFCDSCVYVNNITTKNFRYNSYVEGKEDRDFAMQIIKSGLKTARTTEYAFSAPANGSNKGGLKEIFYDIGKESICVDRMVETWGSNICKKIIKENGRIDVKIDWKNINANFLF